MFPLRCLRTRQLCAGAFHTRLLRVGALSMTLAVAACASDEEHRRDAYGHSGGYPQQGYIHPQHTAMAAGAANRGPYTQHQKSRQPDVEDDGLPSQVPPPVNRKRELDDPSEPFSPNYGNPNAPRPAPAAAHPARQAGTRAPAVAGWRRNAQ